MTDSNCRGIFFIIIIFKWPIPIYSLPVYLGFIFIILNSLIVYFALLLAKLTLNKNICNIKQLHKTKTSDGLNEYFIITLYYSVLLP